MVKLGSLCTGYGGLDMAVRSVFGGDLAFVADNDPAASAVLACRLPGVPNLGDITAYDWDDMEPVDILTAGFPCQDLSAAGARRGLREGTRSGVWTWVLDAAWSLRPKLLVIENVKGILSAGADSDVEPCAWCLGDSGTEHALRALGAVLGDLAGIGFDAEWTVVSAAAAGAPHRRERVFVVAWPAADPGHGALAERSRPQGGAPGERAPVGGRAGGHRSGPEDAADAHVGGRGTDQPDVRGREPDAGRGAAEDPDGAAGGERRVAAAGQAPGGGSRADAGGPGGARAAADAERGGRDGRPQDAERGPEGRAAARRDSAVAADPGSARLGQHPGGAPAEEAGPGAGHEPEGDHGERAATDWGPYAPAIARWEAVLGRPAPRPTEPGKTGDRLSPRFVEWMMGLPDGWVTDVPGLSRTAQLRILGNGVVPQQGELAVRLLLAQARHGQAADAA